MKLSENRPLACGVLALVIAGTLFIGGGNALSSKAKAVDALFYASSESISAELKELADNATVMNSIAANAKGVNQTYVTAVTDSIGALRDASSVFASAEASSSSERLSALSHSPSRSAAKSSYSRWNRARKISSFVSK